MNKKFVKTLPYSTQKGGVNNKNRAAKIAIFLVVLALFGFLVYAVQVQVSTFTDGNSKLNVSIANDTNTTLYVDIPVYSYVTNFSLFIKGVEIAE